MRDADWISLAGIATSLSVAALSLIVTDRARKRERQADKEDKDRAAHQARQDKERAAAAEERRSLLASLMPLVSLLADFPPSAEASDQEITDHIERLRSESTTRALEAVTLVGLIYPSRTAQVLAGYVRATVSNVIMVEMGALDQPSVAERHRLLAAAADHFRQGEEKIRDLAREIRGPLPWEATDRTSVEATTLNPILEEGG